MSIRTPLMGRLPAVFTGRRRTWFVLVVVTGIVQALAAAGAALLAPKILSAATAQERTVITVLLLAAACGVGLARWAERFLSERLAQDYVHGVRLELVRSALTGEDRSSLGVTVARTTNDLTAVRNWIVLGIVPLVVGVPVLAGVLTGLALLHPLLAGSALVPLAVLTTGLVALSPAVFARARALRRRRGRLASYIADTVGAGDSVRRAGGIAREVSAVADHSHTVVEHAVSRAVVTGGMRGLAAAVAASVIAAVSLAGSFVGADAATLASAVMLVGMLTVPLTDLGRIGELRQGFLAAERILAPHLERAQAHRAEERRRAGERQARELLAAGRCPAPGVVHVADLDLGDGPVEFLAQPGECVVPWSTDPERVRALVSVLTGDPAAPPAWVNVAGYRLCDLPAKARRLLVGEAGPRTALGRGTLARAVRYRVPEGEDDVRALLRSVGLEKQVGTLEKKERTRLTRGGEPLAPHDRARVHLARALYGGPPLLILDGIDAALGASGRAMLRERLAEYPGVAIVVSDDPEEIVPGARRIDLDDTQARPLAARA